MRQLIAMGLMPALVFLLISCANAPSPSRSLPQSPTANSGVPAIGDARTVLRWQTETESNTFGYYVYRANQPDQDFVCINIDNPLHAKGTSTTPRKYVYYDLTVAQGKTYYYKLQSRDLDGSTEWIIGADKAAKGTAKPLSDTEVIEIMTKGRAYGEDASG